MTGKTTRREFLKHAALAGAAVAGLPGIAAAAKSTGSAGKSRVIVATDPAAMRGEQAVAPAIEKMLDRGVAKLMSTSGSAEAWRKLFKPEDVVGIKINCLFGRGVATRPEVVDAIIHGLKTAGVGPENIIVWDRSTGDLIKCGFTPSKEGPGVRYEADDGAWGEVVERGAFKGRITTFISDKITAMVNAPILKTHRIAGISSCLKNHYGSFDNPGSYHGNHCDPAMADFNAIPVVREKTRLVVIDALRPQYDGGPGLKADAQFNYCSLITSLDPVAADAVGLSVIQTRREKAGLDRVADADTAWLASAQQRGVGIADLAKIDVLNV